MLYAIICTQICFVLVLCIIVTLYSGPLYKVTSTNLLCETLNNVFLYTNNFIDGHVLSFLVT